MVNELCLGDTCGKPTGVALWQLFVGGKEELHSNADFYNPSVYTLLPGVTRMTNDRFAVEGRFDR